MNNFSAMFLNVAFARKINFFLICISPFFSCSPEQRKKGVSIADYLPSGKSNGKTPESAIAHTTIGGASPTSPAATESQISVTESLAGGMENNSVQVPAKQRKFSFKKGKVRWVIVCCLIN